MELLHQILGHRSTRSLLARYTTNIWKYIDIRVYPDLFGTSCKISTINKNPIYNTPLNTKTSFKWVFMYIIRAITSKSLTKDNNFALNCGLLFQTTNNLCNGKHHY